MMLSYYIAYIYHYALSPKVYIIKLNNAYKMKVEGVSESIFVIRTIGEETYIEKISEDGFIIVLIDGSIYEVLLTEEIKTMLWLPAQKVIKTNIVLLNINKLELVYVRQIK